MITSITNEKNLTLGKHCGNKTGQTALVSGDYTVLTFHANEVEERKGFLLLFTAIPEGKLIQINSDSLGAKKYQERKVPEMKSHIITTGCLSYLYGVKNANLARLGYLASKDYSGSLRCLNQKNITEDNVVFQSWCSKGWKNFNPRQKKTTGFWVIGVSFEISVSNPVPYKWEPLGRKQPEKTP